MRPRVQWALFCRHVSVDQRGLATLSDLVHVLPLQSGAAQLWLVASVEGPADQNIPVTLRVSAAGSSPVTLPTQDLAFGSDGFAELKAQLPPVAVSVPGVFSVDLSFGDEPRPSERVAVKIASPHNRR